MQDLAEQPEIVKADANAQPVVRVAVTSAGRSPQELTQLVTDRVEDRLISIPGVADLQIYGDREPIFRIDINQLELASRGLTLADLRSALGTIAYDAPAGDLTGDRQSLNVRTPATITTAGTSSNSPMAASSTAMPTSAPVMISAKLPSVKPSAAAAQPE